MTLADVNGLDTSILAPHRRAEGSKSLPMVAKNQEDRHALRRVRYAKDRHNKAVRGCQDPLAW